MMLSKDRNKDKQKDSYTSGFHKSQAFTNHKKKTPVGITGFLYTHETTQWGGYIQNKECNLFLWRQKCFLKAFKL